MPAIQPARLRQQAVLLAEAFDRPAAFVRSLHHLLDFYADRAHRPGQSGSARSLLPAYHVRAPVLRQLIVELGPYIQAQPQAAFELGRALWEQEFLEFRMLAISITGQIPPQPPEPVLAQLGAWLETRPESTMIEALLTQGLARVRQEFPEQLLAQIDAWLEAESDYWRQIGLRALRITAADPAYPNLPYFFSRIQPFVRSAPAALRPYVLDALYSLIERSPQEAAYFLRQTLEIPESPDAPRLVRQAASAFPPQQQESLRQALRKVNPL